MSTTTTGFATEFITFSRGSLATVTDSNGYIKWAPHNLLLASEQFDASSWTLDNGGAINPVVTANAGVAPNGTTTADRIVFNKTGGTFSRIQQSVSSLVGATYTFSVWMRTVSGSTSNVGLRLDTTGLNVVVTGTWQQFNLSITSSVNALGCQIMLFDSIVGNDETADVYAWGAHLYRSDLGGMQANASAYPYYNPSTPKNLLGFTEAFDNGAWAKSALLAFGSGSVVNAIAAPNGSLSADLIVPDTTSAAHLLFQNSTVGGLNVQSAYVKPAGYTKVGMRESQTGAYFASFDLVGSGSVLTASSATASITALNDGWYRIAIIGTISGTTRWSLYILDPSYTSGGLTGSWTANGTSGIYLWGAQLSDSASLDPYVGSYGAAPSAAAAYGPRLDYDPSTLAAKGLLVEEQRTNLLLNSATLSTQSVTVTATAHTLSFYGTGTVTLSGASSAGPLVGTGVYPNRVTLTFTPTAGTLTLTVTGTVSNAQLEAGAFATSYIPTAAASATRNADVASVATSQFPYSATEGSIVANVTPLNVAAARRAVQIDDGTENERYTLSTNSTPNGLFTVIDGGSSQAAIATGTPAANTNIKLAARYKVNDFALSVNGGAASTDTSGTLPIANLLMRLGSGTSSTEPLNGHIRQITYIPRALTNAELTARST